MSYIQNIAVCNAPYKHKQTDILEYMIANGNFSNKEIVKIKKIYAGAGIETRYAVLNDFSIEVKEKLFQKNNFPNTEKRMQLYFEHAPAMCKEAITQCIENVISTKDITHLITVSCIGMCAPGLDILLQKSLGLNDDIHKTSLNFMGCYAAIHALKYADAICKSYKDAHVIVVCVELCSLHFQDSNDFEQIAASLLFADGAAAMYISNQLGKFSIEHFYSKVVHSAAKDMSWHITSQGFRMSLSTYVPEVIATNISPMLHTSLQHMQLKKDAISYWAIHPGGKKILIETAKALQINNSDLQTSYGVLKQYGNMSSVSIVYVLHAMFQNSLEKGKYIYAAAFGPGLTMETMLLRS